jgi:hypothetical protein
MYAGAPAKAAALIERQLPAFRRAFLLRVYAVKAFTAYLQTAAWVGAIAHGASDAPRLQASIRRACKGLGSDAASRAVPVLVGAGLATLRGDLETAVDHYRRAATAFDAVDMMLMASSARWRLGELLGGDEGRVLIEQTRAVLAAEGVVRPDRVVAMFAPVAADARRFVARE